MNSSSWEFTLLDTGFFRTGQPFHAGEGGYSRIESDFPPPMSTLQGAIRSALAVARGWRLGQKDGLPDELGDNKSLGWLSLRGPYLVFNNEPLFPAPLNLLIKETPGPDRQIQSTYLIPGKPRHTDLGTSVCLPRKKEKLEGAHLPEKLYFTRAGLQAVAEGREPLQEEMYQKDRLWCKEERTGLKRSAGTRTAEEKYLYRIEQIRPVRGLKVLVIVSGIPPGWPLIRQKVVPLGGEGRPAAVKIKPVTAGEYKNLFPPCPPLSSSKDGKIRFTISLITPCSSGNLRLIRKGPTNVPGRCVSACIGKVQRYGGWDLQAQLPRPLRPYLPPGSTWFFEAASTEIDKIEALHGSCIDDEAAPAYGYGQVLIGKWEVD